MKLPRSPAPAPPAPVRADDELDFAALMQREGVTPVAGERRPARPARASVASRDTTARSGAPGPEPAATRPAGARPNPAPRAAPTPTATRPATTRGGADDARLAALRQELAALAARHQEALAERDAAVQASAALRAELTALRAAADANEAALRAAADANEAALRAVHAAPRSAPAELPRSSLAAALTARGLLASESAAALALLGAGEAARRLLELLETRDSAELASLLERRLALVCGDPACAPELGAAALRVEPARCEVCGGSDIQRAAHGFARACAAAGVVRVRFVGGSPNYRTKLAALFPAGGPLTVHTTAGDKRVRLNRSRMQQRGDDLVIIWGATELDHATSGVYRSEHGRTVVIAHRGIGRMLDLAAARLAAA